MIDSERSRTPQQSHLIWSLVLIGLIAISFASILIKLCQAPSLVIAAYRLTIAAVLFITITLLREGSLTKPYSTADLRLAALSGVFLCLHFATWISSLQYTSVASSVVLVQTAPIFVAVGAFLFLREKPSRLLLIGIVLTVGGGAIIGAEDFVLGESRLAGDLLALGGAIGAAGYWIAGRRLRARIGILHYASVVYGTAAVLLFALAVASGATLYPYPRQTLLYLVLIALVPQVIGHTSFNYGLRFLSAPVVSVLVLGEPVGATILAYLILGEGLSVLKIVGAVIILFGVCLCARSEQQI